MYFILSPSSSHRSYVSKEMILFKLQIYKIIEMSEETYAIYFWNDHLSLT